VNAGISEEWERGGFCEKLDVDIGDVAHNVVVMIHHGE